MAACVRDVETWQGTRSQPHALPLQGGVCMQQAMERAWRTVPADVHELCVYTRGHLFVVLKGFWTLLPD